VEVVSKHHTPSPPFGKIKNKSAQVEWLVVGYRAMEGLNHKYVHILSEDICTLHTVLSKATLY
jgi:hypothetical protein